ncbi:MAG: dCTP deaminase [Candidatus Paceibacteria bacterium]|jgi:dCTP deaminase
MTSAVPLGQILVDEQIESEFGRSILASDPNHPLTSAQVQPASLDLRLGPVAHSLRAGFLPGKVPLETRVERLSTETLSLEDEGCVLERGQVYLVPLEEELDLPADVRGRFNPRSSSGRCDIFTRILCCGHARFDETPAGYRGKLWIEISSLSFPVRLKRGDRLGQLRLQRGQPALSAAELREVYEQTPLCFDGERPLSLAEVCIDEAGGLELGVSLRGREPAGWRAARDTGVLDFAGEGCHARHEFWEPVHAPDGRAILAPESFYIFASREHIRIPPQLAAEMLPVDVGIGELRNNYAGFFDNGFGWRQDAAGRVQNGGTPAVLEVRAHDVPFLVEDGQSFCRLRFFHTTGLPRALYGRERSGPSYQKQGLTLARAFHPNGQ